VAAGLVPFALGSETIGSIVSPSAFCGVTGLRPTHGAVSRAGAMSLAWSMDKIGPMTHSSADCALVLSAIAGADPADATTEPWQYEPSSARKFRLGVPAFDLSKHPHMRRAFGRALSVLRGLGMGTRRVKLPQAQLGAMSWTFLGGEVAAAHEEFLRSPELDELVDEGQRAGLRSYLDQKASAYSRALLQRVGVARDVRALFAGVDAIVCPSYFNGAPRADQPLRRSLGRRRGGSGPDPTLGAVAGLPGLCLPIGFDKDGLPIAMTITGDRFAEATILRIGQLFQRETDWHQQHPRVR
jgi:aspartyl-tRNA(Asn)/glutamyl-tRNA(Gln) amidotransferase subunit A